VKIGIMMIGVGDLKMRMGVRIMIPPLVEVADGTGVCVWVARPRAGCRPVQQG